MSFLSVDLHAVEAMLQHLGNDIESAARPAAQAASQVLYDEMMRNIRGLGHATGNLESAGYQAYSKDNSGPGRATYHIAWNHRKAPHGQLVEFGYIQRYAVYVGKNGHWYTAVRPEARNRPKPKRRASQAVKDAYYVPLASPKQIPARSFVRRAAGKFNQAAEAGEATVMRLIHAR
jgi:hypothetical protein